MKFKFLIIFVLLFSILFSQENITNAKKERSIFRPVIFGLVYPLSTNHSKHDSTYLNLALIQNTVGKVKGVNLCGFSAVSSKSVKGIQGSLLYSQINENLKGVSFSTINVVNHNIKGVQFGTAANLLGGSFVGFQSSGIVNFLGGNFVGYQQSTVFNIVGKSFVGLQTAGAGNVVGGNFKGVQFGSSFNFVGKVMKGLQWSGVNVCAELTGLQVGWINISQINHKWQIGVMNLAEEQKGIPVGLINISDDGDIQWQNYVSNFAGFVTAVRFISNNFVSSVEMGAPNLKSDYDSSALLGFHYGYRWLIHKFGLETDLGFFHIENFDEDGNNDYPDNFALQLRFSATFRINKWLEIYGGFGGSTMSEYVLEEDAESIDNEDSYLYFAGINLF
ncbi:MAG: hypothetical protein K9N09_04935 [Candidatus Cloacimonetes bacterium]|nr:hypothetical protein [Candidatus Cloacimonadota bacterium]MCF7813934.1 hypothetical protein [Candidatus Cloacimonadota bacterium]MCF7868028.1 hypothetical protein [Candidatus Cloacimonadota bacterium]MCF7883948.1 hypothetical protein [Candidatus Cloacimonadota bacterium]